MEQEQTACGEHSARILALAEQSAALEKEIFHEPRIAFVGGVDGGDFYRKMIPLYKNNLQSGGFFAFEIGYDQGELLRSLGEAHGMQTEIVKDYSGLDRIAILKKQ